ncbi:MAG: hypothetical protein QG671_786 [Actinomycetota bacterium]|nr:hypothetical protein [Actinomycetota bacterium]
MHDQDVAGECGDQQHRQGTGDPAHPARGRREAQLPAVTNHVQPRRRGADHEHALGDGDVDPVAGNPAQRP